MGTSRAGSGGGLDAGPGGSGTGVRVQATNRWQCGGWRKDGNVSVRQREARRRAREVREAQLRAARRRQRLTLAGVAVAVVLLAVVALVVARVVTGSRPTGGTAASAQPASTQVLAAVSGVPAATLNTVGRGSVDSLPKPVTGQAVLTADGKPLVVYLGAEYCPFCAAQRWPLVVALSRFGTFQGLSVTHSTSQDVFPDTATLSFHGASYSSRYLTFQGVETQSNVRSGNGYAPLDTPTDQQRQLLATFDAPPYVSADSAGAIPFLDFGSQAVIAGASYSPQLLAGKPATQIATALANPADPITQAVAGSANAFTALLCKLTGGQPGDVCASPAAVAYQGSF
jgi:Domain of unknown function (DUF929)